MKYFDFKLEQQFQLNLIYYIRRGHAYFRHPVIRRFVIRESRCTVLSES